MSDIPSGFEKLLKFKRNNGFINNVTQIKRIEALQSAIQIQIDDLFKENPLYSKVILITFSDKVQIYGDCLSDMIEIENEHFHDMNKLIKIGSEYNISNIKNIKESRNSLSEKIFNITENGYTALGFYKIKF
jgi:hypothetical protein